MSRKFTGERNTKETQIKLSLDLDNGDKVSIKTGIGFLDHMLELFSCHGGFGVELEVTGDIHIDYHHTVEDTAILLGRAFYECVGDKKGINRYGNFTVPMDETLVESVVDFSGRPYLVYNVEFKTDKCGSFDMELVEEFFRAFTNNAKINLHINMRYGTNSHHISEAVFKSAARALNQAVKVSGSKIMSTKGILE